MKILLHMRPLLLALACTTTSIAAPPNLLLILVDDMGYGDISCYGSKQIQTPHIDALAASGIRCTQGYVSSAVCAPSRAGLLTGRYQNRFGFEHNLAYEPHLDRSVVALPQSETTLADRLKAGGYRTGLIGKWHLGRSADWHHPNARGFDSFFGMLKGNHHYFPTPENNHLLINREPVTDIKAPYLTDWFTDEAINFMQDDTSDQPWFLFLSYNTPHTPLQAKDEDIARFAHIADKGRRIYCAMQHCLDQNIGRVMAALDSSGQREDTLVVFLSDNGGPVDDNASINAPLRGRKSMVLEGGIRVPFIWSWPGHLPAQTDYTQPLISLDILHTFLAAAGIDLPAEYIGEGDERRLKIYDGIDLLPFLRGERGDERPHQALYWRMILRGSAIRDGDWKLVRLGHRPPELYALMDDVSELTNVADQHPDKVSQLMRKLSDWELTFAKNPNWISDPYWMGVNRTMYDLPYILVQPEP